LEFIPIFEGLYIIYNVEHSINATTQRLETTFKAYRLKKDVNPIVTEEIIDFTKSNYYTGAISNAGQQGAQAGVQIAVAPVAQTGTYNIYGSRGEGLITKYWQIKQHHPPKKGPDLQKYKVHSTPGGNWTVAYRDSAMFPRFKNDDKLGVLKSLGADYAYLQSQNDAYNMVVSDYVFKQGGNSKVGIPAPFDGKVVFRLVNKDGLPQLGLIDSTGKKTCIMLHWSSPNVSAGDTIKKGQRLATQDTLGGGSTGVHLHIEGMFLDDWIAYVNFVLGLSAKYDGVNVLS
jgi:hypothetical protein